MSIVVDEHHRISRDVPLGLIDRARRQPSTETLPNLFWNVLAWRVAGNFRNVGRIVRAVAADPDTISLGALTTRPMPPPRGRVMAVAAVSAANAP